MSSKATTSSVITVIVTIILALVVLSFGLGMVGESKPVHSVKDLIKMAWEQTEEGKGGEDALDICQKNGGGHVSDPFLFYHDKGSVDSNRKGYVVETENFKCSPPGTTDEHNGGCIITNLYRSQDSEDGGDGMGNFGYFLFNISNEEFKKDPCKRSGDCEGDTHHGNWYKRCYEIEDKMFIENRKDFNISSGYWTLTGDFYDGEPECYTDIKGKCKPGAWLGKWYCNDKSYKFGEWEFNISMAYCCPEIWHWYSKGVIEDKRVWKEDLNQNQKDKIKDAGGACCDDNSCSNLKDWKACTTDQICLEHGLEDGGTTCFTDDEGRETFLNCSDTDKDGCVERVDWRSCLSPSSCVEDRGCVSGCNGACLGKGLEEGECSDTRPSASFDGEGNCVWYTREIEGRCDAEGEKCYCKHKEPCDSDTHRCTNSGCELKACNDACVGFGHPGGKCSSSRPNAEAVPLICKYYKDESIGSDYCDSGSCYCYDRTSCLYIADGECTNQGCLYEDVCLNNVVEKEDCDCTSNDGCKGDDNFDNSCQDSPCGDGNCYHYWDDSDPIKNSYGLCIEGNDICCSYTTDYGTYDLGQCARVNINSNYGSSIMKNITIRAVHGSSSGSPYDIAHVYTCYEEDYQGGGCERKKSEMTACLLFDGYDAKTITVDEDATDLHDYGITCGGDGIDTSRKVRYIEICPERISSDGKDLKIDWIKGTILGTGS